ncbi:MAG: peptidoglycan DD-metalloendopeptidase family protein [Thiotrichaceae bacterium]|nr:peptidoglycan DD-metalloendopeptidase family protein [Thiotrichaceae bacterium]
MIIKELNIYSLFTFFLVVLLSGCAATYAPVEQRSSSASQKVKKYSGKPPSYYTVKTGDTLYSIAWVYGFDYKTIAKINKINSPYRIYAGQRLAFKALRVKKNSDYKRAPTKAVTNKKVTKYSNKKPIATRQTNRTKTYTNKKNTVVVVTPKSSHIKNSKLKWSWPVKGKLIQKFSPAKGKKGIDISSAQGVSVKASEAGKVVYSGQGLVGYGRMVIIKHNETFLSAYAHNQNLLVNEGQFVKKGQSIALLGRSGTDKFKLHFEIRKNGKPVNPLTYLPR